MSIANVTLNSTFDEWRLVTNQLSNYVNDVSNQQLIILGPSLANTARDQANLAFAQANVAYTAANTGLIGTQAFAQANTARDQANLALTIANSGVTATEAFTQANTARNHANAAFAAANSGTSSTQAFAQANTARDQANAAFSAANAASSGSSVGAFIQANTARDHANASFTRANTGFSNTSGSSFVGNLQIPTGNLSLGIGTNQGLRLTVNSQMGIANVNPQIRALNGTQYIQFNSNTSVGAWNDLMLDRDVSIIFTKGTSDDGANLVIGPWTDSSFGYKQDGAGRHGFNTSNPRYTLDANGSANISGTVRSAGFYDSNNRLLLIKDSSGTVVWGT